MVAVDPGHPRLRHGRPLHRPGAGQGAARELGAPSVSSSRRQPGNSAARARSSSRVAEEPPSRLAPPARQPLVLARQRTKVNTKVGLRRVISIAEPRLSLAGRLQCASRDVRRPPRHRRSLRGAPRRPHAGARADDAPRRIRSATSRTAVFLRSRDGAIVLFPGGRLQVDSAFFRAADPQERRLRPPGARRARAAGSALSSTSTSRATSRPRRPPAPTSRRARSPPPTSTWRSRPFGDRLIFQAGQFDVPFTLENRTSDAYTDFIERAMVARSLGAPRNKEVGVMVARPPRRRAILLFGRPLQRRRARVPQHRQPVGHHRAPGGDAVRAGSDRWWSRLSIGGSVWYGNHVLGPEASRAGDARRDGLLRAALDERPDGAAVVRAARAGDRHRVRRRAEPADRQSLRPARRGGLEAAAPRRGRHLAAALATPVGDATSTGSAATARSGSGCWATTGCCPRPGWSCRCDSAPRRAPLARPKGCSSRVRGEVLKENLTSDNPTLGDPGIATTRVDVGDGRRQLLARPLRPALGQLRRQRMERHLDDRHGRWRPSRRSSRSSCCASPCRSSAA